MSLHLKSTTCTAVHSSKYLHLSPFYRRYRPKSTEKKLQVLHTTVDDNYLKIFLYNIAIGRTKIDPLGFLNTVCSTRYTNYLEDYWPCAVPVGSRQ